MRTLLPGARKAAPVGAALLVGLASACARQGFPTGGREDRLPPAVLSTTPDTFARVDRVSRIRIEFNERISESVASGILDRAVIVSPREGEVRVKHGKTSLEVEMTGGFRPGQVYRVTLLPVIRDLFRNTMTAPFEFAFSTGAEFVPNAAAGLVLNRVTGEPVEGVEVELRAAGEGRDSASDVVYVSRTDETGIYTFRFVPPGAYQMTAYQDRNRDGRADPFEAQGSRALPYIGETDTTFRNLRILDPDTTVAVLARATPEDSTVVVLEFDDYLDPEAAAVSFRVGLAPLPDTTPGAPPPPPAPGITRVFHTFEYAEFLDSAWRADSTALALGDSLAEAAAPPAPPDTLAGAEDTLGVGEANAPPPEGREAPRRRPGRATVPERLPEGLPLPTRELIVVLDSVLPAGFRYRVSVAEVVNLNGLRGGGGEAVVFREPPPADTAAAGDTATSAPDTAVVLPPDTGRALAPRGRRRTPRP